MSKITWLILLILWLLLGLWVCKRYLCGNSAVVAPIAAADKCAGGWDISDSRAFSFKSKENVRFLRSKFTVLPLSAELNRGFDKVADYLKKNAERSLTITGYYDTSEKNRSVLSNLGLARANTIKRILTSRGVPSHQLEIAASVNADCWRNDTLRRAGTFVFDKIKTDDTKLAAIKKRLLGKPITLYFETNEDWISLTDEQRTDFSDLIYYLDHVKDAKLDVEGHTDNTGDRANNMELSKDRANFARDYLIRNGGISTTRMDVDGFGPDKPIATNKTDEGKAQNRRVEVTLK